MPLNNRKLKSIGRSCRPGLLSMDERKLIGTLGNRKKLVQERESLQKKLNKTKGEKKRIQEINVLLIKLSKRYSNFVRNIHNRLAYTLDDLRLIIKNPSMKKIIQDNKKFLYDLVLEGNYQNYSILASFHELYEMNFETIDEGAGAIPDYSRWRIKEVRTNYERKYWLDTDEPKKITSMDTSNPDYSLRGIHGAWSRKLNKFNKSTGKLEQVLESVNVRKILRGALIIEEKFPDTLFEKRFHILPRTEDSAISIGTIILRIEKFLQTKCMKD